MTDQNHRTFSLEAIAYDAMIERGFLPDFTVPVLREVSSLSPEVNPKVSPPLRDMRDRWWISIDNDDSKDLDQLSFAETTPAGKDRVHIAIADVDILVQCNSAIDSYAAHNTTSIFTPARIFPMLPPRLSTDMTSLNEGVDRHAVVVAIEVGDDGSFELCDLYLARVHNHAKLAYNGVSSWLDLADGTDYPQRDPALADQLRLQERLAKRIEAFRHRQGALRFASKEAKPLIVHGQPVGFKPDTLDRAHALIKNLMIACNVVVTAYMTTQQLPMLRRVVLEPKRWDRIEAIAKDHGETLPAYPDAKALQAFLIKRCAIDPATFPDLSLAIIKLIGKGQYVVGLPGMPSPGHFDLALTDYAHTTAPNRRYPDLVMQRLLKAHLCGLNTPYSLEALATLAQHCTHKESDATKVERRLRKSAAAMVLAPQVGREFVAMVTGSSPKGTWVRLLEPSIEGRLTTGGDELDVGDQLRVKLFHVDIPSGHIDFARA